MGQRVRLHHWWQGEEHREYWVRVPMGLPRRQVAYWAAWRAAEEVPWRERAQELHMGYTPSELEEPVRQSPSELEEPVRHQMDRPMSMLLEQEEPVLEREMAGREQPWGRAWRQMVLLRGVLHRMAAAAAGMVAAVAAVVETSCRDCLDWPRGPWLLHS